MGDSLQSTSSDQWEINADLACQKSQPIHLLGSGHWEMVSLQHWGMFSGGEAASGEGRLLFMLDFQGL